MEDITEIWYQTEKFVQTERHTIRHQTDQHTKTRSEIR